MNNVAFAPYWQRFQDGMFPLFEEYLPETTDSHWRVIAALDIIKIEDSFYTSPFSQKGRPKIDREKFARAFVAKAVLNISTTVALIDRLEVDKVLKRICGWIFEKTMPCETSFSNAFREFAESNLLDKVHERLIKNNLKNELVFHISRDSTAIEARESVKNARQKQEEQHSSIAKFGPGRPKT